MKKNLKITGKVLFERHDFIKMITEVLQATEDLQLERVVPIDEEGNPIKLHSLICYVHQIKSDEIPNKFDPPRTINIKKGFSRPNRGIGRAVYDMLEVGEVYDINELLKELKEDFPNLDRTRFRRYLQRPDIFGVQVDMSGDEFIVTNKNPNFQSRRMNVNPKTKKGNG